MGVSEVTKKILEKAGWTPWRKIDIQSYEEALIADGYEISDNAKKILTEFGGLEIIHPAYKIPHEMNKSHLDPIRAIGGIYREKVEAYEERIGEKLVVIGEAYNEQLVLLVSESGKIFGAYDDFLTCFGNNELEALECLCENKETTEIS